MRTIFLISVAVAVGCAAHDEPTPPPAGDQAFKGNSGFLVTADSPVTDAEGGSFSFASISERMNIVLPIEPVQADVMSMQVGERGQELVKRFRAAISEHPEWWIEYSQKAKPADGGVPHHPNMGLTREEYEEMGQLLENMSLAKSAEVSLVFLNRASGKVALSSKELSHTLDRIVVDFKNDVVETPYGILDKRNDVDNQDPNAPTGPWAGPGWKLEESGGQTPFGTVVQFALGRRTLDQRGVLYYRVRRVLPDEAPEKIDLFLLYDQTNE